jgi:hypothetical protein
VEDSNLHSRSQNPAACRWPNPHRERPAGIEPAAPVWKTGMSTEFTTTASGVDGHRAARPRRPGPASRTRCSLLPKQAGFRLPRPGCRQHVGVLPDFIPSTVELSNDRRRPWPGLARVAGVEPATHGVGSRCSPWLSYTRSMCWVAWKRKRRPVPVRVGGAVASGGRATCAAWAGRSSARRGTRPLDRMACARSVGGGCATTSRAPR